MNPRTSGRTSTLGDRREAVAHGPHGHEGGHEATSPVLGSRGTPARHLRLDEHQTHEVRGLVDVGFIPGGAWFAGVLGGRHVPRRPRHQEGVVVVKELGADRVPRRDDRHAQAHRAFEESAGPLTAVQADEARSLWVIASQYVVLGIPVDGDDLHIGTIE